MVLRVIFFGAMLISAHGSGDAVVDEWADLVAGAGGEIENGDDNADDVTENINGYEFAGDNFCANGFQDLPQTAKPGSPGNSKTNCANECNISDNCSGFEWYNSGWGGSKCHLILGETSATNAMEGNRWQDATCWVRTAGGGSGGRGQIEVGAEGDSVVDEWTDLVAGAEGEVENGDDNADDVTVGASACSVKTCEDLGWANDPWTLETDSPAVCGQTVTAADCYSVKMDYYAAEALCIQKGARLCTEDEYSTFGSGGWWCSHDYEAHWTSTPCNGSDWLSTTYNLNYGRGEPISTCVNKLAEEVARGGRCCADHAYATCNGGTGIPPDDCAGVQGGDAVVDRCGVCGGTDDCVDCDGVPNGGAVNDECGVCNGDNSSCSDCNGVVNGGVELDSCGVCGGTDDCVDCDGVPNGGAVHDECGVCNGDNSSCSDCNGVVNGGATVDLCGVCGGDSSTCGLIHTMEQLKAWCQEDGNCGVCNGKVLKNGSCKVKDKKVKKCKIFVNNDVCDRITGCKTHLARRSPGTVKTCKGKPTFA